MANYSNLNSIREIPITDFLARLGHFPKRRSGKEIFFLSMLREENTPSLCVNDQLGLWFDHGGPGTSGIKGGNIIDLAMAYWYPQPFSQVIKNITDTMNIPLEDQTARTTTPPMLGTKGNSLENCYKILKIKELGNNPAITSYLKKRGIWKQAYGKIKEVYFTMEKDANKRNVRFSAGWRNDLGGWELRNSIKENDFKACFGKKSTTFIPGNKQSLALFEGYFDYLSWMVYYPERQDTVIVLNSVNMLERIMDKVNEYENVIAYFDRDRTGNLTLQKLKSAFPNATDGSSFYRNFKDLNEKLMAEIRNRSTDPQYLPDSHQNSIKVK